jgi:outer membrane protein insertion porin family
MSLPAGVTGMAWLAPWLVLGMFTGFAGNSLPLHAQPGVTGPKITGASFFTVDEIRRMATGRIADSTRAGIQGAYVSAGFLNADVSVDSLGNITISEGSRYTIRQVTVVPDTIIPLLTTTTFRQESLQGEYFTAAAVDNYLQEIVEQLNDRGYPLAVARLNGITIDDSAHAVDLQIEADRRERVVISEIDTRGNIETSRSLITAAAAIEPDQPFTDELAEQVRTRLRRLNVFTDVAEPQLYRTDSGTYGLLITVTEGNSNTFDGIIGYQPAEGSEGKGMITGLVNVILRNIAGTGRRFQVRGNWPTKTTRELEARYGEPFVFGLPLDIELGYRLRQEETTEFLLSYVQHYLSGDLYYGLTDEVSIRLGLALEQTLPEADSLQPCSKQLLDTRVFESTLGVAYDTRSDRVNPVSGVRFGATYTIGSRDIRGPAPCDTGLIRSSTRQRNEVDMEGYLPISGPFVLASGLHGGDIRGDVLQEADLFTFGGQSTVRGYRENLIRASRRVWGTIEARFILARTSFVAAFFDGGYYMRPADPLRNVLEEEQLIYGYGVGAQIETPLGLVRLSFSLGKDDTFETGKVYIGLVNQF